MLWKKRQNMSGNLIDLTNILTNMLIPIPKLPPKKDKTTCWESGSRCRIVFMLISVSTMSSMTPNMDLFGPGLSPNWGAGKSRSFGWGNHGKALFSDGESQFFDGERMGNDWDFIEFWKNNEISWDLKHFKRPSRTVEWILLYQNGNLEWEHHVMGVSEHGGNGHNSDITRFQIPKDFSPPSSRALYRSA